MVPRKLLCSLFAAALFAGIAATPAQAQRQDNAQATFGNLIAALNNVNLQVQDLEILNNADIIDDITVGDIDVRLVNVEDVLNDAQIDILNNALNNNNVNVEVLNDALNNLDLDLDVDLLALDIVLVDGDLIVFVLPV